MLGGLELALAAGCQEGCSPLSSPPREALRWTLFTMQATGHILLGTSCYMQQLLEATEDAKEVESSRALPSLLPRSLPPLPRRKALQ